MKREALKALVKRTPGLRGVARIAEKAFGHLRSRHFSSSDYWQARYQKAGNSGSGSCSRLVQFKADILNDFVRTHEIRTIIEFGSGDGSQLMLARYPNYVGVDVSRTVIDRTRSQFSGDPSKQFLYLDEFPASQVADLTLSLDLIYHLVEDTVFNACMDQLFAASRKYVASYASNFVRRNEVHVRHRKFTDWIERNRADFTLIQTIQNPYPREPRNSDETSFADFFIYERSNGAPSGHG